MKHQLIKGAALVTAFLPVFALAQVNATAQVNTTAQATMPGAQGNVRAAVTASSSAETARAARAKDKAAQEIDRRVASLNAMLTRVVAMKKINDAFKANLTTNVELEIKGFNDLKAKIEADTDLATLKADVKSVTDSYRIYALVMPQVHISVAADRIATIINMMNGVGGKLQARINTAKAAGNTTADAEAALTDLGSKIQSAQTHAQAAVTLVAPLVPDQGDKTVQASNEAKIKEAQAEIRAAQQNLVAARKDITTIIKEVKGFKASAATSTTVAQ